MTGPRRLALGLAIGAGIIALTGALEPFRNYQLATAAAYLCATAGLTVLTGLGGQLSLGHGALLAVGAYTVAFTQNGLADAGHTGGWLLPVSLAVGVGVTTLAGVIVGVAAARLHGPYLAGATLALAVAIPAVTVVFDGVFHGEQGMSIYLEPAPDALGANFPYERWQAWIAVVGAVITVVLLGNLVGSRYGRNLRAVRDDEVAASLAGIPVARTHVLAFVVSAAAAGLGGGLLAFLAQGVTPGAFPLTLSLFLLIAVVIGGLGSLAGAVWGALLLVVLPDLAQELTGSFTTSPQLAQRLAGNLPLTVFGLLLIVVMILAPVGVQGAISRVARAIRQWRRRPSDSPKGITAPPHHRPLPPDERPVSS